MKKQQGYYRFPTINNNHIIFTAEDDLWSILTDDLKSVRLTTNLSEVSHPRLSPDGKLLAFTGREDGNSEVYVMSSQGGPAERLTFQGANIKVSGWDGNDILYTSDSGQPFMRHMELFRIDSSGGYPQKLPYGLAHDIGISESRGVILGRNTLDPARWKRYRGGTAGELWIDSQGSGKFKRLLNLKGNFASPMWINGRIYFISDHEGIGNIYSCGLNGSSIRKHSDQTEYYARNATTDGSQIVYHAGGDLYLLDPSNGDEMKLDIDFKSPTIQTNRKFISACNGFQDYSLNQDASLVALNVRGKSIVLGAWEGPVYQQGDRQGVRYQHINFHSDNKRMLVVSDKGGSERLEIHYIKESKRPLVFPNLDIGRPSEIKLAPTKDLAAIVNHRNELLIVDLNKKSLTIVDRSKFQTIAGFNWSPDNRYIAYACSETLRSQIIKIYDRKTEKSHSVTQSISRDFSPVFDPRGKYLYFLSNRIFNPVYDDIQFELSFPMGTKPFAIVLNREMPSPFVKEADSFSKSPSSNENKGKENKKDTKIEVKIDFEDIKDRVVAFPVSEAIYEDIQAIEDKVFYTVRRIEGSRRASWYDNAPAANASLKVFDFDEQMEKLFVDTVTDFKISQNGDTILIRSCNSLRLLSTKDAPSKNNGEQPKPGKKSGKIDLTRIQVPIEPLQEWQQMYAEAWRLQRDHFWVENMSGVDWKKVYNRYFPLIERVASRSEFSDLMWEMQGELGTSHAYEMGGDYRFSPSYNLGFLGADLKFDAKQSVFIIDKIIRGDTWDIDNQSPFLRPGIQAEVGMVIQDVNGNKVDKKNPPEKFLINASSAEIQVNLAIKNKKGSHLVHLKTLQDETTLRYRDWVETNRNYVHQKTKQKAGYVHIPDMGPDGYAEFHRYFLTEIERDGLVVDVRYNRGGHISQLLLRKLAQKRLGYNTTRWMGFGPYPMEAPAGPMVALTNEYAGSDGDIFSHAFKMMELGKLIGRRTWGGVIGIWPRNTLVDGTITTQPEFSFWFNDVGWQVENYGTDVDIEVIISPQDYAAGKDPQMECGIEEILKELKRNPVRKPKFIDKPSLKLPA